METKSPDPNAFYEFVTNNLFDSIGIFDNENWILNSKDLLAHKEPIKLKDDIVISELTCNIANIQEIDSVGSATLVIRIKIENEGNTITVQNSVDIEEMSIIKISDINCYISFGDIDLSNCVLFQVHVISVQRGISVGPVFITES